MAFVISNSLFIGNIEKSLYRTQLFYFLFWEAVVRGEDSREWSGVEEAGGCSRWRLGGAG